MKDEAKLLFYLYKQFSLQFELLIPTHQLGHVTATNRLTRASPGTLPLVFSNRALGGNAICPIPHT